MKKQTIATSEAKHLPNPPSPSNSPNPLSLPSPSHPPNPCLHPPNPRFKDSHNNMYEFFTENNLISPNQLGFKQDDSCINQLLYITHEMYKSFDDVLRCEVYF